MNKILIACLLLFSTAMVSNAQTGEKNFIDKPYIEVTGKAEMQVTPDRIYMSIGINEKDSKGKIVLAQTEKEMIAKLKALGIDTKKDLSIKDMSSNFKKYWVRGSDILTSKEYQLLVTSAQMAGTVMQELEKIGISNVVIEQVDHSQMEQFRKEVKIKAIKAARDKATDMAMAIGQTAGKAIYIQEVDFGNMQYGMPVRRTMNVMFKSEEDTATAPDIEFEKIKIEYQVNAKFELN
ncbi:MAG TPA: SIMPL domain-containing protein [Bacteroidales bacterium]|nr:SIMPL domain-containing protein [Bacteroidales bacterium]